MDAAATSLSARGALVGAALGATSGTIEIGLWTIGMLERDVVPPRTAMLLVVLLDAVLGACLGLAAAPLLRSHRGELVHLAAVAVPWAALGVVAGLPALPLHLTLLVVPWIAAPVLVLVAIHLARRPRAGVIPPAALFVLLAATLIAPELAAEPPPPPPTQGRAPRGAPDVLLVVLDTVRADHVSAYGYDRPTTPVFDRLARTGALFLDATAPATWSLPSHASLFTGRFPSSHGAHAEHRFLDTDVPTLAETLAQAGWDTRCFTANPWISDRLGLTRGFAFTDDGWRQGAAGRARFFPFRLLDRLGVGPEDKGGAAVALRFEAWARESEGAAGARARPTFAFVNLVEAHFPYHQVPGAFLDRFGTATRAERRALSLSLFEAQFGGEPPSGRRAVSLATDLYDGGVRYTDHLLGRLVAALRARGTLDRTVLVVLSDHGELLGEHGAWGHGGSLHQVETRVPLFVRYPGRVRARERVEVPVSTVGVLATILELAGVDAPAGVQVGSLLATLDGATSAGPVISEQHADRDGVAHVRSARTDDPLARSDLRYRSFRVGALELVEASDGSAWLFDSSVDASESRDLAAERPADVARLRSALAEVSDAIALPALESQRQRTKAPALDAETRERLRALGYE